MILRWSNLLWVRLYGGVLFWGTPFILVGFYRKPKGHQPCGSPISDRSAPFSWFDISPGKSEWSCVSSLLMSRGANLSGKGNRTLPLDSFLASLRRGPQLELKLDPVSRRDSEDFQSAGPETDPIQSEGSSENINILPLGVGRAKTR